MVSKRWPANRAVTAANRASTSRNGSSGRYYYRQTLDILIDTLLLGRRGGLSAFTSDELEALSKLYARVDFQEPLLRQAVEQSREKTIPAIAFQLQRLSDQNEIANL